MAVQRYNKSIRRREWQYASTKVGAQGGGRGDGAVGRDQGHHRTRRHEGTVKARSRAAPAAKVELKPGKDSHRW